MDKLKLNLCTFSDEDKERVILFYQQAAKETDYLSFDEDEYIFQSSTHMLIATYEDKIIGICTISCPYKRKSKHVGALGIAILKEYWNNGIAKLMIHNMISTCRQSREITKISLLVRTDNKKAVSLYKSIGFSVEGELEKDTFIAGLYYNTYSMAMFI